MKVVRRKSNIIPYRLTENHPEFFLSHRSKTAKQYPDHWSFWGGGIEQNETPEQALVREAEEELRWVPRVYEFLGTYYDSMPNEKFIYVTEVDSTFENKIEIHEGQGGRFFTIEQISSEPMIISEDKTVLIDLYNKLK